jgi:hypothetical protein
VKGEKEGVDYDRRKLIRYFGSESSIVISGDIDILSASCFNCYKNILSVSFAVGSPVRRILSDAFSHSWPQSVTILRSVEIMKDGYFHEFRSTCSISVESDWCAKRIVSLTFCQSSFASITIPRTVKRLMPHSFSDYRTLPTISVERGSQLYRIESEVFSRSSLTSIVIPQSVTFIHCGALSMMTGLSASVEGGSGLFRIGIEFIVTVHF